MKRSIQDFKSFLSGGGVRPTMYEVRVTLPDNFDLSEYDFSDVEALTMLTKSASVPSMNVSTVSIAIPAGGVIKQPGSRSFEPWSMTIINDRDLRLRRLFEKWNNTLNSTSAMIGMMNTNDYLSTVDVIQLDREGEPVRFYTLHGAYPSAVSAMQLGYELTDQLSTTDVTFQYQYFTVNDRDIR